MYYKLRFWTDNQKIKKHNQQNGFGERQSNKEFRETKASVWFPRKPKRENKLKPLFLLGLSLQVVLRWDIYKETNINTNLRKGKNLKRQKQKIKYLPGRKKFSLFFPWSVSKNFLEIKLWFKIIYKMRAVKSSASSS